MAKIPSKIIEVKVDSLKGFTLQIKRLARHIRIGYGHLAAEIGNTGTGTVCDGIVDDTAIRQHKADSVPEIPVEIRVGIRNQVVLNNVG